MFRNRARQRPDGPPTALIGALLRLPHEAIMTRIQAALAGHGHDVTSTELGVFLFPGPDARRPIELARQCGMTRQAMNYVLAGLERRDYLERHDAATARARVVRVTERGRKVIAIIRAEVRTIEREWTERLGERRFEALRTTLLELALWLGKL
ncbi:MAG TPA: MarR family transcriptional regulator [Myxococcaceae bacterium]|nr:MarR family transcriptional regulator [Myxococcaceae bacterium]